MEVEAVSQELDVRVLVVDDQEPYRRAMQAVVDATNGFTVVGTAVSGEDSVDVARDLRPQLVLMDVNLPGIDGIEATRQILADGGEPIVVLLSTYDRDDVDLAGSGASDYIPKGAFGPDRLIEAWTSAHRDG
jgi:DNA-binding NarL/FixJ family response regulator